MDVELEIWGSDREGITHDNSPNQTTQCMTIMPRDYIKTSLILETAIANKVSEQ